MKINEELKKECMEICKKYEIDIDFNNEDWENKFIELVDWEYISFHLKISEKFIEKFQNKVNWQFISCHKNLSEKFIKKFQNKVIWDYISKYQKLSESFIQEFQDYVNWDYISNYQKLSENFIEKFQDKVVWYNISRYQILSESFIEKFQDKVSWDYISKFQKLSKSFIEKFQDKVDWDYISYHQKLSEKFIEKFQDKVIWYNISRYQKLSENFIEKYIDKFDKNDKNDIILYQRISKEFAKKHNIEISRYNWYQKSYKWKLKFIKKYTDYEILNDDGGEYIIGYKAIREDNRSFCDPKNYEYVVGKEYESSCDCDVLHENSFGLAAWNKENAIEFGGIESYYKKFKNFKLIKVKIYIKDIGAIIKDNSNKIRCFKFEVIEDLGIE